MQLYNAAAKKESPPPPKSVLTGIRIHDPVIIGTVLYQANCRRP